MKEVVKLANAGLAGEPERIVFQNPTTLKIYDLDSIVLINRNGIISEYETDDWKLVLHNENHLAEIEEGEDGIVLYV